MDHGGFEETIRTSLGMFCAHGKRRFLDALGSPPRLQRIWSSSRLCVLFPSSVLYVCIHIISYSLCRPFNGCLCIYSASAADVCCRWIERIRLGTTTYTIFCPSPLGWENAPGSQSSMIKGKRSLAFAFFLHMRDWFHREHDSIAAGRSGT